MDSRKPNRVGYSLGLFLMLSPLSANASWECSAHCEFYSPHFHRGYVEKVLTPKGLALAKYRVGKTSLGSTIQSAYTHLFVACMDTAAANSNDLYRGTEYSPKIVDSQTFHRTTPENVCQEKVDHYSNEELLVHALIANDQDVKNKFLNTDPSEIDLDPNKLVAIESNWAFTTPIFVAVVKGQKDVVKKLVEVAHKTGKKIRIDVFYNEPYTADPLMGAIRYSQPDLFRFLIENAPLEKLDWNRKEFHRVTYLDQAIENYVAIEDSANGISGGDQQKARDLVLYILSQPEVNLDPPLPEYNESALLKLISNHSRSNQKSVLDMVHVLLETPHSGGMQTNVNRPGTSYYKGETAILRAANYGNIEIIKALLAAGADWRAKATDGSDIFDCAIRNFGSNAQGSVDVLKFFFGIERLSKARIEQLLNTAKGISGPWVSKDPLIIQALEDELKNLS